LGGKGKMKFTVEQIRAGIERHKRLLSEHRASFRLSLAKYSEDRIRELEAELSRAEPEAKAAS